MPLASTLAVVALCRWQLKQRLRLRVAWLLGWAIAFGSAAMMLIAPELGLSILRGALVAGMWLVAGPAALALADDPASRDRLDGLDVLFRARGISARRHLFARVVAGAVVIALRVAVPLGCVVIVAAAVLGWKMAAAWLLMLLLFVGFFSIVFSCIALTCGYGAAERGKAVFLVGVLLPWLVADAYQLGQIWSLPGLLMLTMDSVQNLVSLL